jgi:hypothetical protein
MIDNSLELKKNIIPLSYNNDKDNIKNIILIHDEVYNYNQFYESANIDSYPIIYNTNSSKEELTSLFRNKFINIERIAFVFHNSGVNSLKSFIDNKPFFTYDDLEENVYSDNLQYIIDIVKEFNIKNLDFLACNTLQYDNWKKYYNIIHKETDVIIGASNDLTGNINFGGDWILESTNEDIKNIYFTDNITEYQYTLDTTIIQQNGGTIYIKQESSTSSIQYSSDNSNWTTINNANWPVQIINTLPSSSNVLTLLFNTDITFSSTIGNTNGYFIIGSQYITINGNNKIVTIDSITSYPGLIQNGDASNNGFTYININYLGVITSNNSTLANFGGWIGKRYFGKGISSSIIYITNSNIII